jgi:Domain of unknown function (DUF4397)
VFVPSLRRRLTVLAAAAFVAVGLSTLAAPPAYADGVGYVRLAHLAPDCIMVDVYIVSQTGAIPPKIIPSVDYGRVSDYMALPSGAYAVALRDAGAPATEEPELATQLTVEGGRAYTVAALGKRADLGARVLNDDLSMPAAGKARVRIVQAAAQTPFLSVSVTTGAPIAEQVAYASSTGYRDVDSGRFTVKVQQQGGAKATTLNVSLDGGSVYSLFILDRETGLSADLRSDALRQGAMPAGGVETGAGGTAPNRLPPPVPALTLFILVGTGLSLVAARPIIRAWLGPNRT